MNVKTVLGLSLLVSISGTWTARAQLPPDQTIHWRFRENPADPSSAITLEAVVKVTAWEVDGNAVAWSVARVEFRRPLVSSSKTWVEVNPPLDTPDGLWWVTHIDPQNPELTELLDTPRLRGRAFADDPADQDISYDLSARSCTSLAPYKRTAAISYVLAAADTDEPIREGENEPVETQQTQDAD